MWSKSQKSQGNSNMHVKHPKIRLSTWVNVYLFSISASYIVTFLFYLQHTASTVLAAAHPAPCLLTFHRRGWCQLHQPQRQPWFQPTAQTHAPLLPGNGLWPVSFIHNSTWLFAEETYMVLFFLQQIDWYHQRMCVFCLGTRRTGGEEREGGQVSLFVPLHPGLSWELKPSVRKGWEETEWALDDPYKLPWFTAMSLCSFAPFA